MQRNGFLPDGEVFIWLPAGAGRGCLAAAPEGADGAAALDEALAELEKWTGMHAGALAHAPCALKAMRRVPAAGIDGCRCTAAAPAPGARRPEGPAAFGRNEAESLFRPLPEAAGTGRLFFSVRPGADGRMEQAVCGTAPLQDGRSLEAEIPLEVARRLLGAMKKRLEDSGAKAKEHCLMTRRNMDFQNFMADAQDAASAAGGSAEALSQEILELLGRQDAETVRFLYKGMDADPADLFADVSRASDGSAFVLEFGQDGTPHVVSMPEPKKIFELACRGRGMARTAPDCGKNRLCFWLPAGDEQDSGCLLEAPANGIEAGGMINAILRLEWWVQMHEDALRTAPASIGMLREIPMEEGLFPNGAAARLRPGIDSRIVLKATGEVFDPEVPQVMYGGEAGRVLEQTGPFWKTGTGGSHGCAQMLSIDEDDDGRLEPGIKFWISGDCGPVEARIPAEDMKYELRRMQALLDERQEASAAPSM